MFPKKKKKPLTALRSVIELNNAFKLKASRGRLELRCFCTYLLSAKDFAAPGDGVCCRTGSVYRRIEHAELQDQRSGAERSQPLSPDMLFGGKPFYLNTKAIAPPRTHTHSSVLAAPQACLINHSQGRDLK